MPHEKAINEIKKRLNRGGSAVFIIGQGIDFNSSLSWKNPTVKNLYSDDAVLVKKAWQELLKENPKARKIPFISEFTRYVSETAMVKLSEFKILNSSISGELGDCAENTVAININGLLHKGVSLKTGLVEDTYPSIDLNLLYPSFIPITDNYAPFYDVVSELEAFVNRQDVKIVFFIGTSGDCPIVESIFNRSLSRTSIKDPVFKCVINTMKTYMDEEADLVIREDACRFLEKLALSYRGEGFF